MNAKHKWYNEILAWAEGAIIEMNSTDNPVDSGWLVTKYPSWDFEGLVYRVQPPEPPELAWYENMPTQGVLCWVSDTVDPPSPGCQIDIITAKRNFFIGSPRLWELATPLTNEEIRNYLRDEE